MLAWASVHTVYALCYTRLYYAAPIGGIDFNGDAAPCHLDFAYVALTVGMASQVSDLSLTRPRLRRTAIHHALLWYLFAAVVVALMINVVAGLLHAESAQRVMRPTDAAPGREEHRGGMTPIRTTKRSVIVAAAVVGVLIALLMSACGESKADKEAAQYADSLCTSISGWETRITAIASRLDTGSPSTVTQAKLNEAAASTVALVGQIHELDVPDVDGADAAKQSVDRFVVDSTTTVASVRAGVRQLQSYGAGAQSVAAVALPLALQLEHLVTEGRTTVSQLEAIKGPFEHAVKKSKACQALKPSSNEH